MPGIRREKSVCRAERERIDFDCRRGLSQRRNSSHIADAAISVAA